MSLIVRPSQLNITHQPAGTTLQRVLPLSPSVPSAIFFGNSELDTTPRLQGDAITQWVDWVGEAISQQKTRGRKKCTAQALLGSLPQGQQESAYENLNFLAQSDHERGEPLVTIREVRDPQSKALDFNKTTIGLTDRGAEIFTEQHQARQRKQFFQRGGSTVLLGSFSWILFSLYGPSGLLSHIPLVGDFLEGVKTWTHDVFPHHFWHNPHTSNPS